MNPSHDTLARQSLARPLTEAEVALATALERAFAEGIHDFAALADWLQRDGVPAPSGEASPWTREKLGAELSAINASLDDAYARRDA